MKKANPVFPKRLKVGSLVYEIRVSPRAEFSADQLGDIIYEQLLIRISADVHPKVKATVLLHEVLHAASYTRLFDQSTPDKSPEQIIESIEFSLFSILRENPEVVKYILEAE